MSYLPGLFDLWVEYWQWTQAEYIAYICVDYLLIATYIILVLLALRNIWQIIVK